MYRNTKARPRPTPQTRWTCGEERESDGFPRRPVEALPGGLVLGEAGRGGLVMERTDGQATGGSSLSC